MTTCKNCRHWEPDKGSYGICRKISEAGDWQNRDPAVIHAWADDDSNLGANLLTKPDFGCVSFEDAVDYETCPDCGC